MTIRSAFVHDIKINLQMNTNPVDGDCFVGAVLCSMRPTQSRLDASRVSRQCLRHSLERVQVVKQRLGIGVLILIVR